MNWAVHSKSPKETESLHMKFFWNDMRVNNYDRIFIFEWTNLLSWNSFTDNILCLSSQISFKFEYIFNQL